MVLRTKPRVLLLDQDQKFFERLNERLCYRGIHLEWKSSLFELGSVGCLGNYDLILVDPLIGPVNGMEVAAYASTFFPGLPVLLVSNQDINTEVTHLPKSVVGFAKEDLDTENVVAELMRDRSYGREFYPIYRKVSPISCASA